MLIVHIISTQDTKDFEKIYDKDESDYIWKQEILTNVLGKAFGEWFGKNYSTLWW